MRRPDHSNFSLYINNKLTYLFIYKFSMVTKPQLNTQINGLLCRFSSSAASVHNIT